MTFLKQIIRFGLVGIANTGVYYSAYLLLRLVMVYLAAHLVAWVIALVFSFWLNCVFTYRIAPTWRRFLAYPLTALPNIVLTTVGVVVLVEWLGLGDRIAPLVAGVLAIPATFIVMRFILVQSSATSPSPQRPHALGGQSNQTNGSEG